MKIAWLSEFVCGGLMVVGGLYFLNSAEVRVLQQNTLLTLPLQRSLWLAGATIFCRAWVDYEVTRTQLIKRTRAIEAEAPAL